MCKALPMLAPLGCTYAGGLMQSLHGVAGGGCCHNWLLHGGSSLGLGMPGAMGPPMGVLHERFQGGTHGVARGLSRATNWLRCRDPLPPLHNSSFEPSLVL